MNRTSKTRSASSGTPYLKPKLISWIASRVGGWTSPSRAKIRSRSSRSDRSLVSSTTSASARTGSSRRALRARSRPRSPARRERVAVAGLREPPDQDVVARLEEDDHRADPAALERAAHRPEREGGIAGADVEHDRRPGEPVGVAARQVGEVRQQLARQVVDDDVAEVLEQLRGGRLAAAGQAGERRRPAWVRSPAVAGIAGAAVPIVAPRSSSITRRGSATCRCGAMEKMVPSNRRYIVSPRTIGLTRSPPGVIAAAKIAMPRIAIRRDAAAAPR